MKGQSFILGVNYWPQTKAMFMWREFDRNSIKEDIAAIRDLGFSCVNTSLLWEDFQPEPRKVSPKMLDRLVDFLDMGADRNLTVMPTLFTGHASGLNWLPPWMLLTAMGEGNSPVFSKGRMRRNKIKNPYSDIEIIEAQIYFLREVMSAVSGHPALVAWNLGNQPSLWTVPPDETSADLWLQAMAETLKEKDDAVPVTLGLHVGDLMEKSAFLPKVAAKHLDYIAVHTQRYGVSWVEGPLDATLLPFLGCMTAWLGKKPVLIQEFGLATVPTLEDGDRGDFRDTETLFLVNEDEAAQFSERAISYLQRFSLIGGFWKSFGDYHPSIWNRPPLDRNLPERYFGLLRHDGSPKPAAAVFKSADTELGEAEPSIDWLDMSEEDYYKNPTTNLSRLYGRFREYYDLG